jgi:hypothetical protein
VRLLLDANLSPARIGAPLRERGHDVRALAAEPELEGLADELVLEFAARDGRILVTRNGRDFAPICRAWAEAGRQHAGVMLVWRFSTRQFGEIVEGVSDWLEQIPAESDWQGTVVAL